MKLRHILAQAREKLAVATLNVKLTGHYSSYCDRTFSCWVVLLLKDCISNHNQLQICQNNLLDALLAN